MPGTFLISLHHRVGVIRIVQLQVEDRSLVFGSDQILQNPDLQKLSRPLALFHDAGDAEIIVQNFNGVADVHVLGPGK